MNQLKSSRIHKSIRGEILCLWKLLDSHFRLNSSKYVEHDSMFGVSVESMITKNQFSGETLFYCWTCWKDNIVQMLDFLSNFKTLEPHQQQSSYARFALNYLGVQKKIYNQQDMYLLLIPDANWVMKLGDKFLNKNGRPVSIDVQPLLSYAQRYWCSELLSVGMDVLRTLNKLSNGKTLSELWQIHSLLQIFEVSKFLLKSNCFRHAEDNLRLLEKYSRKSIDNLGYYIIHLDWKKSLGKKMVYHRITEHWQDIMKELIYENTKQKGNKHDNSYEIMNQLKSSRIHKSIRGEILCLWKLLDSHFRLNSSKYVEHDNMFGVSVESMITKNQFYGETLFYCWTCWKDNIVQMLDFLSNFKTLEPHQQQSSYAKFALNYLGVHKKIYNQQDMYLFLIPDANWVMKLGDKFLNKNGRPVSIDVQPLLSYAQRYWCSELLSVGMDVLRTLNKLSNGKTLS
ncbi:hypothetical protein RYX36_027258 [Vicia faba]